LAAFPFDVRRGTHQVARRPLLAGPDVSGLSLRDPADAQSVELVLQPAAGLDGQGGCPLQSPGPAVVGLLCGGRHPASHTRRAAIVAEAYPDFVRDRARDFGLQLDEIVEVALEALRPHVP